MSRISAEMRIAIGRQAIVALLVIAAHVHGAVSAAEITLNATAIGYIRRVPGATYRHFPTVGHLTGSQGNGILHTDNNSYFVFDLSGVSSTITAAKFQVYTSDERADVPQGGYWSSSPSEQLLLREVTTDPTTLMNYSTAQYNLGSPQYNDLDAMFTDLASGALYGSTVITEAAAEAQPGTVPGQPGGKIWDIPLGSSAVNSLNAATGRWALGASLAETAPPISSTTELLFGGSVPFSTTPGRATPVPQLVLTVTSALTADFDADNDVDGRDFLLWQRGFGLSGQTNNSNGDADGNGMVSSGDLALWQHQFGSLPSSAIGSSVPEPGAWAQIFVLAVACLLPGRHGFR